MNHQDRKPQGDSKDCPTIDLPTGVCDASVIGDRILRLLSDGLPHSKMELKGCVDPDNPELVSDKTIHNHLTILRQRLAKANVDVEVIAQSMRQWDTRIRLIRRVVFRYGE